MLLASLCVLVEWEKDGSEEEICSLSRNYCVMCSLTDHILKYFVLSPLIPQAVTECTLCKCQALCELDTGGLPLQDVPNAVYLTSQADVENAK